jgi:hypothetical protein
MGSRSPQPAAQSASDRQSRLEPEVKNVQPDGLCVEVWVSSFCSLRYLMRVVPVGTPVFLRK